MRKKLKISYEVQERLRGEPFESVAEELGFFENLSDALKELAYQKRTGNWNAKFRLVKITEEVIQ